MNSDWDEERFWSRVNKTPGQGPKGTCWTWSNENSSGYGMFDGTTAHRVSWIISRGSIPGGLFVLHHCDVKRCVRPSHLFLGTQQENLEDMTKKGRRNPPNVSGELNPRHKLSFKQVQQIRMLRQSGVDARLLAAGYGITRTQVYNIARRHSWKEN